MTGAAAQLYLRAEAFGGHVEGSWREADAQLIAVRYGERRHLHGVGPAVRLGRLAAARLADPDSGLRDGDWVWLTPKAAHSAGLLEQSAGPRLEATWDEWSWMGYTAETPRLSDPTDRAVVELDATSDANEIDACLTRANPTASLGPDDPDVWRWWGARIDGSLAGVIAAAQHEPGRLYELHSLGTVPSARGRGIGGALLRRAVAETLHVNEQLGMRIAILGVFAGNTSALAWYERFGFCEPCPRASFRIVM